MTKSKKAFIFDTNFILQNIDLKGVVSKLKDEYVVYVTQVSVEERINQACKEEQKEFDLIEEKKKEWKYYATILVIRDFKTHSSLISKYMQKNYEDLFKEHLIPYTKSAKTFETILDRAYKKVAPFKEEGSDNGFKDSLMWLSILEYFKDNGEKEVLFLTDDKGFLKQKDKLIREFSNYTGKSIQIESNEYYKIMGQPLKEEKTEKNKIDYKEVRERIEKVVYNICWTKAYDSDWGEYDIKTFVVRKKVDSQYIKRIFAQLKDFVKKHIFTTKVKASDFLELDNRIEEDNHSIMMKYVDELNELHDMIMKDFPDYEEQFYIAVAEIINENYEYKKNYINDNDLPF
jgi:hypothetical protein